MNNEKLDLIRERIRRQEQEEAEALANHPALREIKAKGDERREEARREEAQREAAREQALKERGEAEMESLKAELRWSCLGSGGSSEDFEKAWPELKAQELARRTLERAEGARRQVQADYESNF